MNWPAWRAADLRIVADTRCQVQNCQEFLDSILIRRQAASTIRARQTDAIEQNIRRGGRVVECTGLENQQGFVALRGFESHPLRQKSIGPFRARCFWWAGCRFEPTGSTNRQDSRFGPRSGPEGVTHRDVRHQKFAGSEFGRRSDPVGVTHRDVRHHKFAGSEFGPRSDPVGVTHRDVCHQSHPPQQIALKINPRQSLDAQMSETGGLPSPPLATPISVRHNRRRSPQTGPVHHRGKK